MPRSRTLLRDTSRISSSSTTSGSAMSCGGDQLLGSADRVGRVAHDNQFHPFVDVNVLGLEHRPQQVERLLRDPHCRAGRCASPVPGARAASAACSGRSGWCCRSGPSSRADCSAGSGRPRLRPARCCTKMVALRSGRISRSMMKLMSAERESASITIFSGASRNSRFTGFCSLDFRAGTVTARLRSRSRSSRSSSRACGVIRVLGQNGLDHQVGAQRCRPRPAWPSASLAST